MEKGKQFNLNTLVLGFLSLLIAASGYFGKHELERIEDSQSKLWLAIMPRHEIELQIQEIKTYQAHWDTRLLEVQSRQTALEISIARMQRAR